MKTAIFVGAMLAYLYIVAFKIMPVVKCRGPVALTSLLPEIEITSRA